MEREYRAGERVRITAGREATRPGRVLYRRDNGGRTVYVVELERSAKRMVCAPSALARATPGRS